MPSNTPQYTYPSTPLAKGAGHPAMPSLPAGVTPAQVAVAQVLRWVARNGRAASALPNATAVAKAAGVHAYAGQYAYRQYLRTSGNRVGRGRTWAPAPHAAARKLAKANAAKAAKAAKATAKATPPATPGS